MWILNRFLESTYKTLGRRPRHAAQTGSQVLLQCSSLKLHGPCRSNHLSSGWRNIQQSVERLVGGAYWGHTRLSVKAEEASDALIWDRTELCRGAESPLQSVSLAFRLLFLKNLFYFILFIFGCIGSLLLCADFSCGERGLLFVAVHRRLIAVASLVAEHRL